jgi:hypothetical protein
MALLGARPEQVGAASLEALQLALLPPPEPWQIQETDRVSPDGKLGEMEALPDLQ